MKNKILLTVACIALTFSACSKKDEDSQNIENVKSVFVTKPIATDKNEYRVFNAVATAKEQIKLSFKVQGNLKDFDIEVGDELKRGEVFTSLDKEPYKIKVSQAMFSLKEAKASLKLAKSSYERTKKLYINQNASASDIDNAKAAYDSALAKVENISKQLEYARLQLSYTDLKAPINGYVTTKYVNENENINAGTPIILLGNKVVDEVHLKVPETLINRVLKDEKVVLKFDSLANEEFNGKIKEVSKSTSTNEKNYLVIIKILNSSEKIKAGMSASVYFSFKNLDKDKLLIPSNSVLNDKKGFFVYVIKKENNKNIIKRVDIKVGKLTEFGYEVTEGLSIDDLVLKAGMSEVFENMHVKIGNKKDLGK